MRTGKVSANFTWSELAVSSSFPALVEPVPDEYAANAERLVLTILQPIRSRLNRVIEITSGYRSPALNAAVKGSITSQHLRAEAADITTANLRTAFMDLVAHRYVRCGQCIAYPRHGIIHIALPSHRYPEPQFFVSTAPKVYIPAPHTAAVQRLWPGGAP